MNNEQLIEAVTREVMKRLNAILNEKNTFNKKRVLILERNENLCSVLTSALEKSNYVVDCIDDMWDMNSYEAIILQNLENCELANLSHGIGMSTKENLVIQAMFNGSRIYCMEKGVEYKKFEKTSNNYFFNMFNDYKEKLVACGMKFVGLKELICLLNNEVLDLEENTCRPKVKDNDAQVVVKKKYVDLTNKKLVSEVELRNIFKQGIKEVLVSKKSIVTPLAMDFARVSRLEINRQ